MSKLTGATRKYLRQKAHHLNPIVMVGKQGLTEMLIEKVDESLKAHELIKIKFVDLKSQKKEISDKIAVTLDAEIVGAVGHVTILFRQNPEIEDQKIRLP